MQKLRKSVKVDNPYRKSGVETLSKSVFETANNRDWPESIDDISTNDYLNLSVNQDFVSALLPYGK